MSAPVLRWAGTRTLLLDVGNLDEVLALHARLAGSPLPGQKGLIAAAETLLLDFDTRAHALSACAAVKHLGTGPRPGTAGREVTVDVVYDGEDLAEVGRLTGLGTAGVVRAHTSQIWTAAFGGFAPGFSYLHGENNSLEVPRRNSPRTAVPAGSVALAGRFSAVYPSRSPGGWQLIGRTDTVMWDLERELPALLHPGDTVRYRGVRELIEVHRTRPSSVPQGHTPYPLPRRDAAGRGGPALTVLSTGPQSLIQDLGRPGFGDLGVPASGAADTVSARQANRLVGNPGGDALIETLLGGLALRAMGELVLAMTGATQDADISGSGGDRQAPPRAPFALHDGETLSLRAPRHGLRSYLAVRGGFEVDSALGSRSTDTLSGIGPAPLTAGTMLPVGFVDLGHVVAHPEPALVPAVAQGAVALRITPGPRADWFDDEALAGLCQSPWTAGTESNRIGIRLETGGRQAPLRRIRAGELASEGTTTGSLQVPPSGLPVLFLADHPVTGGYPVIAVVVPEDLPAAAQIPPGAAVNFTLVDPDTLLPVPAPG